MSRFDKHEKSDRIKWAIIFTLVAALIVGFFAIVTKGFKQNDPKTWFSGNKVESGGAMEMSSGTKLADNAVSDEISISFNEVFNNRYANIILPFYYVKNSKTYELTDMLVVLYKDGNQYASTVWKGSYFNGSVFRFTHDYYSSSTEIIEMVIGGSLNDGLYKIETNLSSFFVDQGGHSVAESVGYYELELVFSYAVSSNPSDTISLTGIGKFGIGSFPFPEPPAKRGYEFSCWCLDPELEQPLVSEFVTEDTVLYARYSIVRYSIVYNINGGEVDGKTIYTIESETYTLPTPTRTGYNFLGWYDNADFNGEPITEIPKGSDGNKVFYAKWEIKVFKLSFYVDGEIFLFMDVEYGTVLSNLYLIDLSTMTTAEFSLTSDMLTTYDTNALISDDLSLFAANDFVIYAGLTYNIDGVETMDLLDYNSTLSDLRVPEKDGYTFDGWYYDSEYKNAVKSTDKLTQNKTIYAKFTATLKTFWQNVGAFFKQWWWCFAAGFGGIVVITVISVIVEQKKKKA